MKTDKVFLITYNKTTTAGKRTCVCRVAANNKHEAREVFWKICIPRHVELSMLVELQIMEISHVR